MTEAGILPRTTASSVCGFLEALGVEPRGSSVKAPVRGGLGRSGARCRLRAVACWMCEQISHKTPPLAQARPPLSRYNVYMYPTTHTPNRRKP